jgi:hypothetical protein
METSLAALILQNTNIANIGDATGLRGSSVPGNLYFGLATADPGEATASQLTNEISYTGYARVAVTRDSSGFNVTNGVGSPVNTVTFPASTGGTGGTVTHFILGTAASGAGVVLVTGTVSPNLVVSNGVTPTLTTSTQIVFD